MRGRVDAATAQRHKPRQSITFTEEQHNALAAIAEKNGVSVCWVVRYACEMLIKDRTGHQLVLNLPMDGGGIE